MTRVLRDPSQETHGAVEKKEQKTSKKVLTKRLGFGNIVERSEIQERDAP